MHDANSPGRAMQYAQLRGHPSDGNPVTVQAYRSIRACAEHRDRAPYALGTRALESKAGGMHRIQYHLLDKYRDEKD